MEHEVEVGALGDAAIGVEVALREVAAAHDGQTQPGGRPGRQRPGAADRRGRSGAGEAVVVRGRGLKAGDVGLDGVVHRRVGREAEADDDVRERHVGGDDALQRHGAGGGRRDARPQDDPIGERIAARHAMSERPAPRRYGDRIVVAPAAGSEQRRGA
jgi:hypothetical protein